MNSDKSLINSLVIGSINNTSLRQRNIPHLSGKPGLELFLIIILSTISFNSVQAQSIWNDKASLDSLKKGIHNIYNFEFEKAENIQHRIEKKYPNQPAMLMYDALILYWKYYPLLAETKTGNSYEWLLLKSLEESKGQLAKHPEHELTIFFDMMPRMMLLEYYADNGLGLRSIPHLSKVYESIIKGFELCKTTPEFYFTTGLYNYYIEAYPEANPFYKPFVIFFPGGDKELGLKQLYKCWQLSGFVGAEAISFLTYIQINFENNYSSGVKYGEEISKSFPDNPLFSQYYIQLLLLSKQYSKANEVLTLFKKKHQMNAFYSNVFKVYEGIIEEHLHSNKQKAEQLYNSAIEALEPFGNYANRYKSYAYFGLSRIYKARKLNDKASVFYSKARKIAQYPQVNFD